jgi:hypothetical protein
VNEPKQYIVSKLTVEAVSGPTCYPGEGGFSDQSGEVETDDAEVAGALRRVAVEHMPVALQCGRLVVVGRLKDGSTMGAQWRFRVEVLDVRFAAQPSSAK